MYAFASSPLPTAAAFDGAAIVPRSASFCFVRIACLFGLLLALVAGLRAQDVENGLVARYALDGDVQDDGPNGYNGRLVGNPTYRRGMIGDALNFDGIDDGVQFLGVPSATFNASFSASWFMQVSDLQRYSLLSKRADCTISNYLDVRLASTSPELIGFELSRTLQIAATVARAEATDGPWIHVAIVRDATSARVYVDGRAGASVNVGTLNFSAVTTALAFGLSPCVGSDGTRAYRGMLDEVRVYNRALTAAEVTSLSRVTALTVTPGSASAGSRVTMRMTNLDVGADYQLRLRQGRTVNQLLATLNNVASSAATSANVPNVAVGSYEIALLRTSVFTPTGGTLIRTTPFTVASGLTFSNLTAQPQAGKYMVATVGNLAPGALQLKYSGRLVAGPTPVALGTHLFKFLVPADFPTSFPATVALRAELLSGRTVIRSGTINITVRAPFTGTFANITGTSTSNPQPRPRDPIRLTGRLNLADDTTPADVQVSAFWIGNNGQMTPLPTTGLTVASDGQFTLDTLPGSFGAMTAVVPSGAGRLRVATHRVNSTTGRLETQIVDGPNSATNYAIDPQTDITVNVRKNIGNGNSVPLEGAYAVLDASAPVQTFMPPPPSGGQSSFSTGGAGLTVNNQPSHTWEGASSLTSNQLIGTLNTLQFPPPECGDTLFRRFTNPAGLAQFPLEGGANDAPGSWQATQTTSISGIGCSGIACGAAVVNPVSEFFLSVYTVHLGAGELVSSNSNIERPSRFRIRYNSDAGTFEIRNEKTGQTTVQARPAVINVLANSFAGDGDFVTISDPWLYQTRGNDAFFVPRIGSNGYGRWVDFQGVAGTFTTTAPVRRIRFFHRPDAGGAIVSAKLYLPNLNTGQPNVVGTFVRQTNVQGCNIQDDPNASQSETWELAIDGVLSQSWRFPRGVYFRSDATERKACGFIESINAQGGDGRRNVCFEWQELPEGLTQSGGSMRIDDADLDDVRFERSGEVFNDRSTELTLPSQIDGEPVNEPRRRDNNTRTSRSRFDRITTSGPASSTRRFDGSNPKQFATPGASRDADGDLANGSNLVEIGNNEYQTIIDENIPLFSWTWGIPELFGAQVYADLRLLADYFFHGQLEKVNGAEMLDLTTDARFGIYINLGADIDVLFGLFFDAGAYITGYALSTMPTVIVDNNVTRSGPCFYLGMTFTGYFDPCNLCPTPVISETYPIINTQTPSSCAFYDGTGANQSLLKAGQVAPSITPVTSVEQRQLHRHPAIAFGEDGNGQMMMLDSAQRLTVAAVESGLPQASTILSTAPNARQPQTVYYAPDRAVAVWVESALSAGAVAGADLLTQTRNQRVVYSLYNGAGWLPKRALTAPGNGEGFPALAACYAGAAGCPAAGEVTAVWQRDDSGDYRNPTNRIKFAKYAPATGWSAVQDVSTFSGVQDITPDVAYLGANPFVVWVQVQGADPSDLPRRRLAMRNLGQGAAQLVTGLPTGILAPSLTTRGATSATVAFTKVDVGTGPIGTRQALHVARANCAFGNCTWTWNRVADPFGRGIYGERPQLVATANGDSSVVMRTFQFRGGDGEPVRPGDPFGTVISSGDLLDIQVNATTGVARMIPISADGATHFGVATAFNPGSEEIVTLATIYVPPQLGEIEAAVRAAGFDTQVAYGKSVATIGDVEMRALPAAPDFVVESVLTNVATPAPGAAIQATVRIGNRGDAFAVSRDGTAKVELRWNLATGTGPALATANLADLAAGGSRDLVMNFNAPATAFADEQHFLYAKVVPADDMIELSGTNNIGSREFPGLPTPAGLASFTTPGYAPVQLGWDAITDPRIAGFRVYRREGNAWTPLGSSPGNGFLDLSAQFGVSRTYAVTSYSIRGVESPMSDSIGVMPVIGAPLSGDIFANGFEVVVP